VSTDQIISACREQQGQISNYRNENSSPAGDNSSAFDTATERDHIKLPNCILWGGGGGKLNQKCQWKFSHKTIPKNALNVSYFKSQKVNKTIRLRVPQKLA
jgi:hypothetical protein